MTQWTGWANLPTHLLPWGCVYAPFDSALFDLVLRTLLPLIVVVGLEVAASCLRARYGRRSVAAHLCADIAFFVIFLLYPTCSRTTFLFFMHDTFDGPGEDSTRVMRFDRSIDTSTAVYSSFTIYAYASANGRGSNRRPQRASPLRVIKPSRVPPPQC
jgi:hypothetical protein